MAKNKKLDTGVSNIEQMNDEQHLHFYHNKKTMHNLLD